MRARSPTDTGKRPPGKRSALIVRYFMTPEVTTLREEVSCTRAHHTFQQGGFRQAPVMRGERMVGIVGERDLAHALTWEVKAGRWRIAQHQRHPLTVGEVMNRDVVTVGPSDHLEDVGALMLKKKISTIPVVEKRKLVGILTESDILSVFVKLSEEVLVHRVTFQTESGRPGEELAVMARCLGADDVLRRLTRYHTPADSILITVHVSGPDTPELSKRLQAQGCRVIDVRKVDPRA